MKKISVIVTNWNGRNLLKKYFLGVLENSTEANEIIFSDDASTDDSVQYVSELQKKYSKIRIIKHDINQGFGKNSNFAVSQSQGELVVLLNNDILPHPGYISNSLKHFKNDQLFGVGFAELGHENWARLFWQSGYLQHEKGLAIKNTHITGWVSGGGSIINKNHFQQLGGFDEIYSPFYSEDLDLGYRAWKSGLTLLWEPSSVVEHKHEATMSKFPRRFLDYVKERNRLLSVWRNVTDSKLLSENRLALAGRVLSGPNYIKIIFAAKRQMSLFPKPIVFPKITDIDILSQFTSKS